MDVIRINSVNSECVLHRHKNGANSQLQIVFGSNGSNYDIQHAYSFKPQFEERLYDSNGRLSKEAELKFIQKAQAGDAEAAEILVENFTPLICSIATKYLNRGVAFIDLMQSGYEGFYKAIKSYNESYDTRLVTWSYYWISQEVKRMVVGQSFIKIPDRRFPLMCEIKRRIQEGQNINRIAKDLNESTETILNLAELGQTGVNSLEAEVSFETDANLHDVIASEEASPEQHVLSDDQYEALERYLDCLEPWESRMFCMKVGLRGYDMHTLAQITDEMDKDSAAPERNWNKEYVRTYCEKIQNKLARWSANEQKGVIEYKAEASVAAVSMFSSTKAPAEEVTQSQSSTFKRSRC
jgi:RNA polymerase sigma factor (sigma-70 family)